MKSSPRTGDLTGYNAFNLGVPGPYHLDNTRSLSLYPFSSLSRRRRV